MVYAQIRDALWNTVPRPLLALHLCQGLHRTADSVEQGEMEKNDLISTQSEPGHHIHTQPAGLAYCGEKSQSLG